MKKDLKNFYKETIVPSLINDFGYKNIEQVPKIVAVSINRGFGEAAKNSKELDICFFGRKGSEICTFDKAHGNL